jgi:hypothetical protein
MLSLEHKDKQYNIREHKDKQYNIREHKDKQYNIRDNIKINSTISGTT